MSGTNRELKMRIALAWLLQRSSNILLIPGKSPLNDQTIAQPAGTTFTLNGTFLLPELAPATGLICLQEGTNDIVTGTGSACGTGFRRQHLGDGGWASANTITSSIPIQDSDGRLLSAGVVRNESIQ